MAPNAKKTNIIDENQALLSSYGDEWWDEKSVFRHLKTYNNVRVPFIKNGLKKTGRIKYDSLKGLKILDVGCGAGMLSEALAIEGAITVGIDPADELIASAKRHKPITMRDHPDMKLEYYCQNIEDHAANHENYYDVVVCSEVVEHVPDVDFILEHCIKALKPGGSIFTTTWNRTFNSWFFGIIWGEYILNLTPKGNHSWYLFRKPEELEKIYNKYNVHKADVTGFFFQLYRMQHAMTHHLSMQFGIHGVKNVEYE